MSGLSLGTGVSNLKSVALTVLELLTFNAQKFRGSRDHVHAPFGKFFVGHVRIVPGNTCVKFEDIALTVLELFAFNAEKFRGSRDSGHASFWTNFWRSCPHGLSLGTLVPNLKFIALIVFEILAFNAEKYRGHDAYLNCDSITTRLRYVVLVYDNTTTHSTTTKVIEITIRLQYDYDKKNGRGH